MVEIVVTEDDTTQKQYMRLAQINYKQMQQRPKNAKENTVMKTARVYCEVIPQNW